jgi:D-psicose/D-tagatose/L-ribulose 3-epimerase
MNVFGLHTFAIAPTWDLDRIERRVEQLKEYGIGLFEIPLLRPEEIDTKRSRAFASRWGVELVPSLGLPRALDIVERPDEGLDFLTPAFKVCAEVGSFGLGGVTYGTIGKTTGRAATKREIDGICRFLERAARLAKTFGLKLGIEPCNRYETHLINRGQDAADIIERVGAENIFIHLDTYHMHIEEADIEAAIIQTGPLLGYFHIGESNRGYLGAGSIDFDRVFRGLAKAEYRGPITFESFSSAVVNQPLSGILAIWRNLWTDGRDLAGSAKAFIETHLKSAQEAHARSRIGLQ